MKKIFILSLSLITIIISLIILNNYLNPNVEGSIKDRYKWMKNVQVLQTDWYGSEGLTFFVAKSLNNNEIDFCKGYVSKNIFQTKTTRRGCVPLSKSIVNEGVVGTSTFNGKLSRSMQED
ncbi:hypothetical protein HNQ94_002295 [Salirhabdus euzebyi]|uniref:Uncharacterized protein n=1 Tax=Salirhabdus euzebyi TaxID=394506 RepID=A0A841Q656_9BACI|nr:hypothetical protein [Salirhabdus euzebyi]MBB6453844.1 hypothetical protein [Salirhabdus euzebyi]